MKNTFIILILLKINCISFGQQNCKYESYFSKVGEASFDAFSKKFEVARIKYKEAFLEIDFPLGQDLRKALKVAKKVNDSTWVESISITLAKGGVPLSYFKDLKDYSWYPKFESEFVSYQNIYKSNFDLDLRQQFLDLRTQDSIYNDNFHKWRKGQKQMTLDEQIQEAKEIYDKFKEIYEKHGFPCEQKMGYYFLNEEIDNFPILVLIVHIYQRGVLYLNEHLGEIVCEGKFRPEFKDAMLGVKGCGEGNIGVEQEITIRYNKYKSKD